MRKRVWYGFRKSEKLKLNRKLFEFFLSNQCAIHSARLPQNSIMFLGLVLSLNIEQWLMQHRLNLSWTSSLSSSGSHSFVTTLVRPTMLLILYSLLKWRASRLIFILFTRRLLNNLLRFLLRPLKILSETFTTPLPPALFIASWNKLMVLPSPRHVWGNVQRYIRL